MNLQSTALPCEGTSMFILILLFAESRRTVKKQTYKLLKQNKFMLTYSSVVYIPVERRAENKYEAQEECQSRIHFIGVSKHKNCMHNLTPIMCFVAFTHNNIVLVLQALEGRSDCKSSGWGHSIYRSGRNVDTRQEWIQTMDL